MIKIHFKKLCMVSAFSMATLLPTAVFAQGAPVVCPDYKKGPTNIPSERTGKKVSKALEAYNLDQVDEALTILYEIDTSQEFDRAFTDRFIGNLLATQSDKAAKALEYLNKAVKAKKLNDLEQAGTLRLIADLNMQEKNYAAAAVKYKEWMDFTCKEDPDVYLRLATAYYEEQKWADIIDPINKSIKLAEKPNKNAYALKLTSYYNRKMYKETIQVAEDTVTIFPDNKANWTQLGFFYMLVEDYKKALSTFEMALNQGYLTKEAEIKALMQLYSTNNIPYKAATLFEKYMKEGLVKKDEKNLSSLASTWNQAKDPKKAAVYYGQAAALSSDPDLYYKQGTSLALSEQYKDALVALQKALDAGADNVGRIHMVMMEASFYSGDFKTAYVHVQEAKKDSSTSRSARSWEPYIKEKAKNRGIKL
ncbi:tetratricopeptide repeat protein [Paraglaciecola sp.]|uniref:tetratricopeptide repeat protein n=1 Tax=Paraglaciecola sp. TaxID=1920173 RepID=UPI003557527E